MNEQEIREDLQAIHQQIQSIQSSLMAASISDRCDPAYVLSLSNEFKEAKASFASVARAVVTFESQADLAAKSASWSQDTAKRLGAMIETESLRITDVVAYIASLQADPEGEYLIAAGLRFLNLPSFEDSLSMG